MTAKTVTDENVKESIVDDLDQEVDLNKLAALKSKLKKTEPKEIKMKKERSLNLGIVGSGQGGSRLVASFFKMGYESVAVINTAMQDLKYIEVPEDRKMHLKYGMGGAAKELELGKAAAEDHREELSKFLDDKLEDSQVNVLCLSLGGGSGAGSCETLVDLLSENGKPLVVMAILPMDTEDSQTKANSLETLAKLAKLTQTKKVNNLICVDNAKIEAIYHNVSQMDFFEVANKAIVEPIDVFNVLSSMPSHSKSLDSMEWSKLFIDGEGLSIYGSFDVNNYTEDTAIAEAVINNLSGNLLAEGFDLKQSRYVGFMITANKNVWSRIPASSVNYAASMINDLCGNPKAVFKGMYVTEEPNDVVKVYSMFSGLGLPTSRVEQLKKDTLDLQSKVKSKDDGRNLTLQLDTGTNSTVSEAQKIKDRIASKSSSFGKLLNNVVDRRK